jgi:hypothetical protein
MRCTSVSTLEVNAKPAQSMESSARKSCQLEGESALHLSGSLSSSLVRARGYFVIHFYDAEGKPFPPIKRGPWVRVFSNLIFDDAITVPSGATSVFIIAKTENNRPDASGNWRISELDVSRGIVLNGSPLNGAVITTKQSAIWQFSTMPETSKGEFVVTLHNLDGKKLLNRKFRKLSVKTDIDVGSLPVGYYDISVQFISPFSISNAWKSGLVVLPEDIPSNEPRFGMDAGLSWYGGTYEMIKSSAKMLRLAGIGTVRDRLSWTKIQPNQQDALNWEHYLKVAKIIENTGLEQLQVFAGAPAWAYKGIAIQGKLPPLDEKAIFEFGQGYAKGLGKIVRNVEFWNEPNLPQFYKGRPYQYTSAMKAFYSGVKSEDKNIRVLIGSVADKPGPFFEEIYKNNAKSFFDIRNWHYYLNEDMERYISNNLAPIEEKWGGAEKPAWLTERGYALVRDANGSWKRSEFRQSEFLVKTYVEGFANGYDRVFFFFWPELIEGDHHTWGILRDDFSPRPAYLALSMLTRHLAGAEPEAIEKSLEGRIFFFRKLDGSRVAVAWGGKINRFLQQNVEVIVQDIFGNKLDISSLDANYQTPLLFSNITNLPSTAIPIRKRKLMEISLHERLPLRLAGILKINGKSYFSDNNKATISIDDDAELEINGSVHPRGHEDISIECISGKGISLLTPAIVPFVEKSFSCAFKAKLSATGESYIKIHASQGNQNDAMHITFVPDIAVVATKNRGYPLMRADSCPTWVSRHSSNLDVRLNPDNLSKACQLNIVSTMNKLGDVWVFPAFQIPFSTRFDDMLGLRLRISKVSGFSFPSAPFLLQLVEKTGGIWLVDLMQDKTGELYTGLFDLAYPAPWKKDNNGKLDLNNLREIMVGWAAYKNILEEHAFSIENIDLLPKLP